MRVLHVVSSIDPKAGGPAVALSGLAMAQAAAGLRVSVLATWISGGNLDVAETFRRQGIDVRLIGPCRAPFNRHPELVDAVTEAVAQADIVHIHSLWEEVQHQAARAAYRRHIPYIIRPCGMLDPWSLAQSRWKKKLYMLWRLRKNLNRACALHFTADTERDLTRPLKLKAPAIVEPNGIDLKEFEHLPPRGGFRAKHGIAPDRPMAMFLSRLHPKKGLELLIPAFAQATAGQLSSALLVIVGPDAEGYQAKIEDLVARHGLRDRVIFAGMLRGADRVAALADADVFVLPSHQENFGIAVVEALAAGTPVIISDQVNIHQQISRAQVGAVVPLDIDRLAGEIGRWLGDGTLRGEAGRRARPFVWESYSFDEIARRWVGHYQELAPAR